MNSDARELWHLGDLQCVMVSCCTGAELQVRRIGRVRPDGDEILLREMYPAKSDLYERALALEVEYQQLAPGL